VFSFGWKIARLLKFEVAVELVSGFTSVASVQV
jgi:hypothetical protein